MNQKTKKIPMMTARSGEVFTIENGQLKRYESQEEYEIAIKTAEIYNQLFWIETPRGRIGNPIRNRERILDIIQSLKDDDKKVEYAIAYQELLMKAEKEIERSIK